MAAASVIILLSALFVNGATDAANSVTGVVCSGSLTLKKASLLAAVFDFLGMLVFSLYCPAVKESVTSLSAVPEGYESLAVAAALFSVVLWSSAAWLFGLPTSESHGMLAGMAGAAAALGVPLAVSGWLSVIIGLLLSVVLAALCGYAAAFILRRKKLRFGPAFLRAGCAATAFFHGAQDGQKFIALSAGLLPGGTASVLICCSVMLCGTLSGGGKIVTKIGHDMAHTDEKSAISADLASAAVLLFLTLSGFPVSTTHVKMTAAFAASLARCKNTDCRILLQLLICWITTFPACGISAYLIIKLLLSL